jgi:DNA (cytosine-5)-methyltransferase 1
MTGREYARLQGVEDSFWVPENRNQAIQAFGDAVCVPVISWIAENLLGKVFP